ncbi:hypothetical protein ScPMuIL_007208 [Solemya velum]
MSDKKDDNSSVPEKPSRPMDSDCCGMGCTPCVFDIYDQEMKIWEQESKLQDAEKDARDQNEGNVTKLSRTEYHKFTISGITRESWNVSRYRFALNKRQSLRIKYGDHVIIRAVVNERYVTRQFTPVSDIDCLGYFEFLIKLYETGVMSSVIRTWEIGTEVDIRGPFGNISYTPNQCRDVYLLAAGTGITPISQMIRCVLDNESDDTRLHLIYCCKLYTDILMKSEINNWARFWNFSVLFALSQEDPDKPSAVYRYGDMVVHGRVTPALLSQQIQPQGSFLIFVCGTRSFETDIIKYAKERGIPETQIMKF